MKKSKDTKKPINAAIATFVSFLVIGFIPLVSFVFSPLSPFIANNAYVLSVILTGIAFLIIGALRSVVTQESMVKTSLETLLIGGIAAVIAYGVGYFLQAFIL